MSTVHIEAKKEEIAKTVLMPGDPKRAEYIAKNYSETKKRPIYICKTKKGFKDNSLL